MRGLSFLEGASPAATNAADVGCAHVEIIAFSICGRHSTRKRAGSIRDSEYLVRRRRHVHSCHLRSLRMPTPAPERRVVVCCEISRRIAVHFRSRSLDAEKLSIDEAIFFKLGRIRAERGLLGFEPVGKIVEQTRDLIARLEHCRLPSSPIHLRLDIRSSRAAIERTQKLDHSLPDGPVAPFSSHQSRNTTAESRAPVDPNRIVVQHAARNCLARTFSVSCAGEPMISEQGMRPSTFICRSSSDDKTPPV